MSQFGLGSSSPKGKGGSKEIKPSNKEKLIEGVVPRYKGDNSIDMDYEEPIVVTIMSEPGIGKTHMAFTFPHVACCDTEMKGEKVWKRFFRKECEAFEMVKGEVVPYTWSDVTPSASRLSHAEDWPDVAAFWFHYIEDDAVQTLMFDSETDLREMAELHTLKETGKSTMYGGDEGAKKVQYALVFGKLKYILKRTKRKGKNLVYTGKVKDEYFRDKTTGKRVYDGYNKQSFFSGYVIHLKLGIRNESGELLYPKHVFGTVLKCENMKPGFYPPWLIECSYRGVIRELVKGEEWGGSVDDYIRDVVAPRMVEMGVKR